MHSNSTKQQNYRLIIIQSTFEQEENIVGQGQNAGYLHFSFSQKVFQRLISQGCFRLALSSKDLIWFHNKQRDDTYYRRNFQLKQFNFLDSLYKFTQHIYASSTS